MTNDIDTIIYKHLHRIAPKADLDLLNPDEELGPTLDIDSIDFYAMMVGISDELKIEIPEEEYGKIQTLNSIRALLIKSTEKAS